MICIQICSKREWKALKEILCIDFGIVNQYPFGEYINFNISNQECIFYHSGATKTRSSAACQFAIDNWKPTINFVLGTCGGVAKNLHILDVVIANKTVQYDCIAKMGKERSLFYEPLVTLIDNSWIDFNAFSDKVYEGIIATADQDLNLESLDKLIKQNVLCADWESGAIAFICDLNNVKCCIVRGITDIPVIEDENSDVNQGIDYRVNTPKVMEKLLKSILPKLISSFI
ncbi:5'-methylthioadenosine/S-adenosylhomocysteine nucleosidase [Clostridium tagluense]|uniref:Nucleoside phosphorylase domain-containing protein n=1 Tax=Clostridium tagluense TaxID=360422 RepID=A0A401ULW2_9CLOT|nr:5'-methylthioadenosine/S-adenosylhomocysteine nucleosidase [Clostridium tagluense]GCD10519.1 hypothetical protein Ctaglu_21420 [Clostridium tagluense]